MGSKSVEHPYSLALSQEHSYAKILYMYNIADQSVSFTKIHERLSY